MCRFNLCTLFFLNWPIKISWCLCLNHNHFLLSRLSSHFMLMTLGCSLTFNLLSAKRRRAHARIRNSSHWQFWWWLSVIKLHDFEVNISCMRERKRGGDLKEKRSLRIKSTTAQTFRFTGIFHFIAHFSHMFFFLAKYVYARSHTKYIFWCTVIVSLIFSSLHWAAFGYFLLFSEGSLRILVNWTWNEKFNAIVHLDVVHEKRVCRTEKRREEAEEEAL